MESGCLAGAVTKAPGVLWELSSRIVVDFRRLRSVLMLCVIFRCRASQLVESEKKFGDNQVIANRATVYEKARCYAGQI